MLGNSLMQSDLATAPDPGPRRHAWRLGVGAHLALGMAIMGLMAAGYYVSLGIPAITPGAGSVPNSSASEARSRS